MGREGGGVGREGGGEGWGDVWQTQYSLTARGLNVQIFLG